uniref:Chorein N-terminal domain-containing protein n=1 Tax=Ditylenchus dipsaci TaxID=166011 RepID=A0A915ER83_9BILA
MSGLSADSPSQGSKSAKKRKRDPIWESFTEVEETVKSRWSAVSATRYKKIQKALSAVLSIPSLPIHIFMHPLVRKLFQVMSPSFELPKSFASFKRILQEQFLSLQEDIKDNLSKMQQRYSLTCDVWTDSGMKNAYLGVTLHYADVTGTLRRIFLGLQQLNDSHTGALVRRETEKILCNYGLSLTNAFKVVTDAGSNMVKAFNEIRMSDIDPNQYVDEEEQDEGLQEADANNEVQFQEVEFLLRPLFHYDLVVLLMPCNCTAYSKTPSDIPTTQKWLNVRGISGMVLNNYVGEYFENLNTDQLSIALLQGQVELENVPLKKTALRKFDIPVQVKSGVIGRLTLKQYEQSKKQQALDALELHHKKQLLMTIGQKLKEDDAERKVVILNNIHIRYEDDNISGKLDGAFNFGIRIENVTIQTTNSQWKPGFVQSTTVGPDGKPMNIFKKLDIKRLSIYWNCNEPFMPKPASKDGASSVISVNDLKKQMSPENTCSNTFILQQPFCMEVRMEKNASRFPLKTVPLIPRFKFDLRPERIEIELSKRQLAQMRVLGREWARFDRARQHRKWRPLVPISESPKSWWKFSYDRVVEEHRRHHCCLSKENLLRRAKHLNAYCKAYRRKLVGLLKHFGGSEKQTGVTKENRSTSPNQEDMAFMNRLNTTPSSLMMSSTYSERPSSANTLTS